MAILSMSELADWRVLDRQIAFGERRMDQRFAKMTAHLIAAIPFSQRGRIRIEDYRLREFGEPSVELDPQEELRRFDAGMKGEHHG